MDNSIKKMEKRGKEHPAACYACGFFCNPPGKTQKNPQLRGCLLTKQCCFSSVAKAAWQFAG
jgi:hypothetical protein